ncbi:MAG: type II toxin-antitoxin system PemK/MazF family toxin [Chitinophagaceae bacterium]
MNQREIWYANLEPVKGSEQGGNRPVVIVSGDVMNTILSVLIICPLTSKIKHIKGCPLIAKNRNNGLKRDSELLVFQVRCIAKHRLSKKVGVIEQHQLTEAISGINLFLKH